MSLGPIIQERFEGTRDHLETYRISRDGFNAHIAICANEAGYWSFFVAEGDGVESSHVQNVCAVRCTGLADWLANDHPSVAGQCYVLYADGKFASEAAEKALMK